MDQLQILSKESIALLKRNNLLINLIRSELIKKYTNEITIEKEIEEKIKSDCLKRLGINSDEEFQSWLTQNSTTEKELLTTLSEPLKISKYSLTNFGNKAEARFLKKKLDLDIVTYSLLRVNEPYLAQELYLRVFENESDFGSVSKKYSIGPEKNTLGVVGPIPLSKGHPKISEVLQGLDVNEISQPFIIDNLWIIVRLEYYNKAKLDEEMKVFLSQEIFNEWIDNQAKSKMNELIATIDQ